MQTFRPGCAALSLALLLSCGDPVTAQTAAAAPPASAAAPAAPCLPGGEAYLRARLRGAVVADLNWTDAQISCESSARPDGHGLRVTIAGPLPPSEADGAPRRLRFVFGIDTSAGEASDRARPTNVTAILEGAQQVYATRGDGHCTTDRLTRTALEPAPAAGERVEARGFCTGPAANLDGSQRLLVTTFDFAAGLKPQETPK